MPAPACSKRQRKGPPGRALKHWRNTLAEQVGEVGQNLQVAFPADGYSGAGNRNRTYDLRITNAPLYQLSYSGVEAKCR